MSLDAAFSRENDELRNLMGTGRRGRSVDGTRSLSPGSRDVSRGRPEGSRGSRGRSRSRGAAGSRRTSVNEDTNWRFSILRHDPSERFRGRHNEESIVDEDNEDKDEDEEDDGSDMSEEEQMSDDDAEFDFDINDVVLPNFRISITEFYKTKSQNLTSLTDGVHLNPSYLEKVEVKDPHEGDKEDDKAKVRKEDLELRLNTKSNELRQYAGILALEKALRDAKSSNEEVSEDNVESLKEKLKVLGIDDPSELNIDHIIDIESKKDAVYEEYKKLLIEKSKYDGEDHHHLPDQGEEVPPNNIVQSPMTINEEQLRCSRTLTLGNFFVKAEAEGKKARDAASYLIYLDLSPDSTNALQYTIGSVVKSGDVLYVINSVDDEDSIGYFEKQCLKLTELISTYLELIDNNAEFVLHAVIETTHHKYPKHLVNELIKYLKPNLLIVGHKILLNELSNYMSDIPLLVVKKKARRRSQAGYGK